MGSSGDRSARLPGMGPATRAPPRLCRLLLPGGIALFLFLFLLLLYLSSSHLPDPPPAACLWGGRPCHWLGDPAAAPEEEEGHQPSPGPRTVQAARPLCQQRDQLFRIQCLQRAFADSVTPGGEVLLGEYLSGWKELAKFIDSLGTAFGLISQETWSKISIMQDYHSGQQGTHYRTLQAMVTFELAKGLVGFHSLPASRPPSGCRTLLRLHRALKWLELFLYKLGTSEHGHPSQLCASAYQEALAPYHSWWVRQAAALAFMAMPSRQQLYSALCVEKGQHTCATLLATVHAIGHVYNSTQEVFSAHEMLQLP